MPVVQEISITLPVADLRRAREFYAALGFVVEDAPEQYADKMASAMLASGVSVCLLTRDYFATFSHRPVVNARAGTQVINALGLESREAVNALIKKAAAAGGREYGKPREFGGAVYFRNFVDPDGHQWEINCMAEDDPAAQAKAAKAKAKADRAKAAAKKKAAKPAAKSAAKKKAAAK